MNDSPDIRLSRDHFWFVSFVIVFLFYFAAPFDWERPELQRTGAVYGIDDDAIENMERGNFGRQVSLTLLAGLSLLSLMRNNRNRMVINGASGWCFLGYMILCMYSIAWADDYAFTGKRFFKMLCLCIGGFALAERYNARQLCALFVVVSGVPIILGIIAEIFHGTFDPFNPEWRFGGGFHSIAMGYHCGVVLIALQPLIGKRKFHQAIPLNILLFLTFIAILMTKSRISFIAAILATLLAKYFYISKLDRLKFILIGAFSLSLLILLLGDSINMEDVMAMGRGEETKRMAGSLSGRVPMWAELLSNWATQKPIFGWGYDSILGPAYISEIFTSVGWAPSNTHSDYINAITGTGYLGFLFFMVTYFGLLGRSIALIKINYIYGVYAGVLLWLIVNSTMDSILRNSQGVTLVIFTVIMKIAFGIPEKYIVKSEMTSEVQKK